MVSKSKISFILFLCIISLISVGFSSWVIIAPDEPAYASGGIIADDEFIDGDGDNLYVSLDEENTMPFRYNENGFVNEDGYNVMSGTMTINLLIDFTKFKEANTASSMKLNIVLSHNDCGVDMFKIKYMPVVKPTVTYTSPTNVAKTITYTADTTIENQYGIPNLSITGIPATGGIGKLTIVVKWNLTSSHSYSNEMWDYLQGYFYKEVYQKIYDESTGETKLKFSVSATLV